MLRPYALRLVMLGLLLAGPASAQIGLPGGIGGALPGAPRSGGLLDNVGDAARGLVSSAGDTLTQLRAARLSDLVRTHPRDLELDPSGAPVLRGEIVVMAPSKALIDAAAKQGISVAHSEQLDALDLNVVTFTGGEGVSAREVLKRLRKIDPKAQFDFNHVYAGAGAEAAAQPQSSRPPSPPVSSGRVRVGLIDTGVEASHPAFAGSVVEQRGFAPGGVVPAGHGTAVASLMTGRQGAFQGAAPGGSLYVADVYGSTARGGSATAIAQALNWMGQIKPAAVNLSLVGPPNALLQASVAALMRRGVVVVAAVSNDGPAAPLAYPASYPGVIAVIGVDGRNRALFETGRASHVDFAAPGADMAAATPGGGFANVRGASFAAPIVTARLASLTPPSAAALATQAQTVGPAKIYGHGLIGADVRISLAATARR
jgi:hypothetical protein